MAMNEGDTIAVFREASAAALAALDLHDRVAAEPFPPGIDVRLHAAIAVGEAALVDGIYTGAVVDQVLRLRSVAGPGPRSPPSRRPSMLVDRVGRDVSIVRLELGDRPDFPPGAAIFGLTRPGDEGTPTVRADTMVAPRTWPHQSSHAAPRTRTPRGPVILDAVQHPSTLVALTVVGFALIFLLVLSPELGMAGLATAALGLGAIAFTGCFAWHYSKGYAAEQKQIEDERHQREAEARTLERRPRAGGDAPAARAGVRSHHLAMTGTKAQECSPGSATSSTRSPSCCGETRTGRPPASRPRCCPTSPRRPIATA